MKILYLFVIFTIVNLSGFYKCIPIEKIRSDIFNIERHMERILETIKNQTCLNSYESNNDNISICNCIGNLSNSLNKENLAKLYDGSSKGFIDLSSFLVALTIKIWMKVNTTILLFFQN